MLDTHLSYYNKAHGSFVQRVSRLVEDGDIFCITSQQGPSREKWLVPSRSLGPIKASYDLSDRNLSDQKIGNAGAKVPGWSPRALWEATAGPRVRASLCRL